MCWISGVGGVLAATTYEFIGVLLVASEVRARIKVTPILAVVAADRSNTTWDRSPAY